MTTQPTDNSSSTAAPQVPPGVGGAKPPSGAIPVSSVGVPLECDPEALEPGATVQLFGRPTFGGRVVGFVPMTGLDVQFCFVGKFKGSLSELSGKPFEGGQFLIAVVKNLTDGLLIARGCWYVQPNDPAQVQAAPAAPQVLTTGPNGQVTTADVVVPSATPVAEVTKPLTLSQLAAQHAQQATTLPAPPSIGPRGVTPGMNEVALLLQRGVAERLLASLHGGAGAALHDSDKSPLERALRTALGVGP